MRKSHATGMAATLILAGCVGIESQTFDEGVVYHLPRTLLTITVTQTKYDGRTWYQLGAGSIAKGADNKESVSLLDEIPSKSIPDPGHRYVAKYRPSPMSDDRLCISRSPTGLLYDVNFASDDRTSEVVFNIARFIAGSIGGPKQTGVIVGELEVDAPITHSETRNVDPLDQASVTNFNTVMSNAFGESIALDTRSMIEIFRSHTAELPANCRFGERCRPDVWTDRCREDNICYRTQLEVPIALNRNGRRADVNYAKVINPWDIGAISATRSFLVHKISKFKFNDGVLVGAVIRKPSEIEEASLLPLHVIYAALHTPSSALATAFSTNDQAKVDVSSQMATLTEKVNANTKAIDGLSDGLGSTYNAQDKSVYQLDCSAPKQSGTLVNLVGDAE